MKPLLLTAGLLCVISCSTSDSSPSAQAEPQISFALESKSHEYYVEQAELWWDAVQEDIHNEDHWFNYYRACRNAQGTADWREDFVDESPALRLGVDIVKLMEEHIPETFTLNYVKGSTGAVDPSGGDYLLKAYEQNPDFPGIQPAMVTYSVSTNNPDLRKEVNIRWKNLDIMNPGLLQYSKNVLASLEPNAILLTQHDNDSYPAWMLQDAYGFREDVSIINIDFLLLEQFQNPTFELLGIPPFKIDSVHVNDYRTNWTNMVQHALHHYNGERPLYIGLTVSPEWYEGFEDLLTLNGLTYQFKGDTSDVVSRNIHIYKDLWDLSNLNEVHTNYNANTIVAKMNAHYLLPLNLVKEAYRQAGQLEKVDTIQELERGIGRRGER